MSHPAIQSSKVRPLLSVKSEGAITPKKDLKVGYFTSNVTKPPVQNIERRKNHRDDSNDESADEERIVVKIDAPSRVSFR